MESTSEYCPVDLRHLAMDLSLLLRPALPLSGQFQTTNTGQSGMGTSREANHWTGGYLHLGEFLDIWFDIRTWL